LPAQDKAAAGGGADELGRQLLAKDIDEGFTGAMHCDIGKPSTAAFGAFSFVTDAGQPLQDKFLHTDS
jgi:hypothetical protein